MGKSRRRAFTIYELLAIVVILAILGAVLYLVFSRNSVSAARAKSAANCNRITAAAIMYSAAYDEVIPISMKGKRRSLQNVRDGALTIYGEARTDTWVLNLVPYLKDRSVLVDPGRGDRLHLFDAPPKAPGDPGFVATGGSFRNQNRFAFYGMNYVFLAPYHIPNKRMGETIPMDWAEGESRRFAQAKDPANTVFFTESQDWNETFRGYYGITAPAMFQYVAAYDSAYIIFTSVTPCSGDWCIDTDPSKAGQQKSTATIYTGYENGSNVSFLDGHSRYMKDLQLAAGTNYPEATPQDFGVGSANGEFTPFGGSVLTDKSKYLWNLDDNYFGG